MGIEPLLFLAALVLGFFLQAGVALRVGTRRRLRALRWMRWHVAQIADARGLELTNEGWAGPTALEHTEMLCTPWTGQVARRVEALTGVRHRRLLRHVPLGQPSTLIVLTFPEPLPVDLRVQALGTRRRVRLGDPILDQLVYVQGLERAAIRRVLGRDAVREPLLELLGRHPLSVVTSRQIAVWVVGSETDLTPILALASELADALTTPVASALQGASMRLDHGVHRAQERLAELGPVG